MANFEDIPKLGFGLMRLPMSGEQIDLDRTIEMVDLFIDSGFTYFDTAYVYNEGKSEETAKAAIVDRYPRDKFLLASKLPAWYKAKTADDAKQMFWTSLKRTGAGYFDFYLLHNLSAMRIKSFDNFGIWDYVQELKEKELIRHVGFSYHDKADLLDEILTQRPEMEFVQLQLNYADWENATIQARKCYEVARKHNKPIIVMEPVRGGMLADKLAQEVKSVFDETGSGMSYASWAMRFAASLDGVFTVLSGMSTMDHMKDNVSYMKDFRPIDQKERAVIAKAQEALAKLPGIPCTACDYCVSSCPKGIIISQILSMMNRELIFMDPMAAKFGYFWETQFGGKGSDCIQCGKCDEACPQGLNVMELVREAAAKYE